MSEEYSLSLTLTAEQASRFARLALAGIGREYPNKPDHVLNEEGDVLGPRTLHPAFYGCFDWHSAVHSHWLLVRLLRLVPDLPEAQQVRTALSEHLTADNLLAERAYLDRPNRRSFERTYGWAWLLKLAEELRIWDDPHARQWSLNLQPLADRFVELYLDYLPRLTYPIRTGTHPNTAFGLAFALDYARTVGYQGLQALVVERALSYFGADRDYPAGWEPGGGDFFSPCLMEADLMRRVLPPDEFRRWLYAFLPGVSRGEPPGLFTPATVTDRTDPQIVHLDGLNLSRAWCIQGIASALGPHNPAHNVLVESARRHAEATLPHVASGNYMGEHWLATFALLALAGA
jgi:hypothetical protein